MPIAADSIRHRYGTGPWVLNGINLSVAEGDTIALMGPSGSGKTTLLSIVGLIQQPSTGRVLVDGRPAPKSSGSRSQVRSERFGWAFQSANVLGRRTVLDNAALGLLAQGSTRKQAYEVARTILGDVGLDNMVDRPVFSLSGGEIQRVCIARALASRPQLLLADEPTGQLDEATSSNVLDAMWRAKDEDTAFLIATHDAATARRCERVLVLRDGKISE